MKGRRIIACLLALVLIVTMIPAIAPKVEAYTTPREITASELNAKIQQLSTMLEGKYFTTTGTSCGNNACNACKNVNVFASTWFINMFGTVTGDQIPTHAYPYGVTGTAVGWTCHGFANFAQWYLFSTSNSDKVTNYRVVDNVTMTRANMLQYAKPGDIIRYTYNTTYGYGHSVIFVSANESNYTVIDNNFGWNGDAKSRVRTHTISYNSSIPMAISRANNYPTSDSIEPTLTMQFSANGGTVDDTYQVKTATPGTVLRLRGSASLSGTILGSIPDGTVLTVQDTATADGYTWAKVTYSGMTGWCAITGLATREGYYLDAGLVFQHSTSKPYTKSWSYGTGGSLVNPSELTISREGYAFLGWSTAPDGSGPLFDPANTSLKAEDLCPEVEFSDQSITLYAIWEDLNPTVLTFGFDAGGGSGTMASMELKKGNTLTLPANQFYKEGDSFLGWYLQREDGLWYTPSGWGTQAERKLLAVGETLLLDDAFVGVNEDQFYTLHALWKNETITGISVLTPPTKDKYTLHSQFDPAGMTLSVQYQDGSSEVITQGFTVGQYTFTQLGQASVEVEYLGYTAWTTVLVYEPPVLSVGTVSGTVDEVVTLPVHYSGNTNCWGVSVILSYDAAQLVCRGYSVADGIDSSCIQIDTSQQGQVKIVYMPNVAMPADTDLVWVHLQIAGQTQGTYTVKATEAVFFHATGDSCDMETVDGSVTNRGLLTLRYDAGLGSNAPASVQARFGETVTVSSQTPVRTGYTFVGWAVTADANMADYQSGDSIVCVLDTVLYAVWKKNTVVQPTLTLSYPTVSFEDQIQYNVYYSVSNTASIVEMGLITFNSKLADGTIADAADVIAGYSGDGGTYMVHTNGIAGKNLGDALYFKVYAKLTDGTYVYSSVAGYNAVAYAKTVLSSATSSKEAKALMVAMLNYGAASQVHFGYKTDALMNAFLTDAGKALVSPYNSSMMSPVVAADSARAGHFVMNKTAFTGAYPTVSFEGAFSINYYFTTGLTPDSGVTFCYWDAKTYASADKLTTANATGMVQMVKDGERWYAAVDGIAAKDMDQTVYVAAIYRSGGTAYTTSVIAYSLGKYCQSMADSGNEFGAAAAVYGYYAKAYFAS